MAMRGIQLRRRQQVHLALDKLSLPHREALTLYFLEDFTIDEISQILSLPPGTVKSRLPLRKRALRTILEEEVHYEPAK